MLTVGLMSLEGDTLAKQWIFDRQDKVRIGRASDNDVVLTSGVVSRRHLEINQVSQEWKVVNLGRNGMLIEGRRIEEISVTDSQIIQLASTGPKLLISVTESPMDVSDEKATLQWDWDNQRPS